MDGFVNDFAKLLWRNIIVAKKEEALGLMMLYAAVQHPEIMHNMLPSHSTYGQNLEEFEKEL